MIKIYHGDCLEKMKNLDAGSIDLTVTSPPYDKLRTYKDTCDWSFDVFKPIADELYRATKQGGVVVWVVGDATVKGSETGSSFRQALYFKEIGFNLHDTMIYQSRKPPLTHNRYEQEFEYMFVFSKGKPNTINHIKVPCTYAGQDKKSRTLRQDGDTLGSRSGKGVVGDAKIKGNIWYFDTGGGKSSKDKEAFKHPAIFPEQLAHDHIISWSNPGDTVLDPFMGSGTTGKMAVLADRSFIGIEQVKEYYDISKERITKAIERLG